MDSVLEDRARRLVEHLAASLDTPYHGSSSMTPAVYDTAWVAMVHKETQTGREWLFPECLEFVLASQRPDGGFGAQRAEVDGILNTMAALLALSQHQKHPSAAGRPSLPPDLSERVGRGREYLDRALKSWNVESTVHVGFEILVPGLLGMLRDAGLEFHFPGQAALTALNKRKRARISPALFYTDRKTTLLHSLESFVGAVDFDKVSHHLSGGAMMGSPSATAAYLLNRSTWDAEAEAYLRFVVDRGQGSVPSAFPISVFETTWVRLPMRSPSLGFSSLGIHRLTWRLQVLSTLLTSGFTKSDFGEKTATQLADFLEAQLGSNGGTTGFGTCHSDRRLQPSSTDMHAHKH